MSHSSTATVTKVCAALQTVEICVTQPRPTVPLVRVGACSPSILRRSICVTRKEVHVCSREVLVSLPHEMCYAKYQCRLVMLLVCGFTQFGENTTHVIPSRAELAAASLSSPIAFSHPSINDEEADVDSIESDDEEDQEICKALNATPHINAEVHYLCLL